MLSGKCWVAAGSHGEAEAEAREQKKMRRNTGRESGRKRNLRMKQNAKASAMFELVNPQSSRRRSEQKRVAESGSMLEEEFEIEIPTAKFQFCIVTLFR